MILPAADVSLDFKFPSRHAIFGANWRIFSSAAKPVNMVAFLAFCHPGLLARFIDFILEPVNDVLAVDVKAIEVECLTRLWHYSEPKAGCDPMLE
jgi:hypothetical protein